jgi:LPS O-antigen subunit length determinant protein (WzzB/FepE family)
MAENQDFNNSTEIDLLQLIRVFWDGRRTIIKWGVFFAALGVVVAFTTPKQYATTITMVPQLSNNKSNMGNMAGLAALAGVNLNMNTGSSDISPNVYPQILASIPYQLELMNTPLKFENIDQPVTAYDYFSEYARPNPLIKYTIGLPGVVLKLFKGNDGDEALGDQLPDSSLIHLTEKQRNVIEALQKLVSIELNQDDGYISLTAMMPEALPSAQMAKRGQEILQRLITEFKIQKATADLTFIQQQYDEIEKQYIKAQEVLASFSDKNKNVYTAMAQTERERLYNEYSLAYQLFTEISKQREQAKIKVKEDTPVFTIVEPASIPQKAVKPNKKLILVIWTFLGGIIGVGIVFARSVLGKLKEEWNKK